MNPTEGPYPPGTVIHFDSNGNVVNAMKPPQKINAKPMTQEEASRMIEDVQRELDGMRRDYRINVVTDWLCIVGICVVFAIAIALGSMLIMRLLQ